MNQLRMFKNDIYVSKSDQSNQIYQECLSIPCSTNITQQELEQVAEAVREIVRRES
jgi:perosamine synthetase